MKMRMIKYISFAFIPAIFLFLFISDRFEIPKTQKSPAIKEAEFPFIVEYEINGKRYIIEDTIICTFTGYDPSASAWGIPQPRIWRSRLKNSSEDRCIIMEEKNAPSALTPKRVNQNAKLVLDYGSPEYYMGDPNVRQLIDREASFEYHECWKMSEKVTKIEHTKVTEKELEDYFGMKIIRFEFPKPLKNSFR